MLPPVTVTDPVAPAMTPYAPSPEVVITVSPSAAVPSVLARTPCAALPDVEIVESATSSRPLISTFAPVALAAVVVAVMFEPTSSEPACATSSAKPAGGPTVVEQFWPEKSCTAPLVAAHCCAIAPCPTPINTNPTAHANGRRASARTLITDSLKKRRHECGRKVLRRREACRLPTRRRVRKMESSARARNPCASLAGGLLRAFADVLLQPCIDGVVPQHAVLRLEHPVVFVGEVEELRFDALALRGGERGDALFHRDAEVELAMDDQDRRLPLRHVVHRVEALEVLRLGERRAALLPLGEPQFFGRVAHHALVEHAVVRDEALPRLLPVAGDPVDHEAAVRGTERAGLVAVEEVELLLRRRPALLQVFQRAVAPVLADRIGERLAVTGRTVEVDHHHRVALAR